MNRSTHWRSLAIAVLIACFAAFSNATTTPPPTTPAVTGTQGQKQQQKAEAVGLGVGEADASAESGSYSATGDVINKSSSFMLGFPTPVWTTVPGAKGTCIVTNSDAGAIGWSFASKSGSRQGSDAPCMLERMFDSAMANCHFHSAELIRNRNLSLLTPGLGDLPLTDGVRNLSYAECEALRRPRLAVTPTMAAPVAVSVPLLAPVPAAAEACVVAPKTTVRRVAQPKPKPKLDICAK